MLRTALEPAIARFLEDDGVIEVMLNPDGRIWVYRLAGNWPIRESACQRPASAPSRPARGLSDAQDEPRRISRLNPVARHLPFRDSRPARAFLVNR
jgi:hypothetical protein